MPAMNSEDVQRLAAMSRIAITEAEAKELGGDIESVLAYVSEVNEITAAEGLTKQPGAVHNVFREDEVTNEPGAATEDLLGEAPERAGQYLKVKKILTQE